jgi:hypothetical protein
MLDQINTKYRATLFIAACCLIVASISGFLGYGGHDDWVKAQIPKKIAACKKDNCGFRKGDISDGFFTSCAVDCNNPIYYERY